MTSQATPMTLHVEIEQWPLKVPFHITGYTIVSIDAVLVTLRQGDAIGRGEAAGVYYLEDTAASMLEQIEAARRAIEAGIDREGLRKLLPPGGARNAVDCALWELEAKLGGCAAWQLAGLNEPQPLLTVFTCSAETPEKMAADACSYDSARAIKLKLTGERIDAERVLAVRRAREDVWLSVDANQGFTRASLEQLLPVLVAARVALIEQPFPIGMEASLDGLNSPIPIAADESAQSLADLPALVGRFDMVNIKLDKCGGLTEGLAMARAARELGLEVMVGNMMGTSLAMAPAFLLGQLCRVADLDGPTYLQRDRPIAVEYRDGMIHCSRDVWG